MRSVSLASPVAPKLPLGTERRADLCAIVNAAAALAARLPTRRERLQAVARRAHEEVDAKFRRFDLTSRPGYLAFLSVHSRVIPALDAQLSASGAASLVSDWSSRRRASALATDRLANGDGRVVVHVEPASIEPSAA